MKIRKASLVLTASLLVLLAGCQGASNEQARLHQAQREFWRARHAQRRLDIYPKESIAEDCLARYSAIIERYPPSGLPERIADPEGARVKLARVGAMASMSAAGILRELGRRDEAIALLAGACREDLPLGAFVERRLRSTLASFLADAGRPREAIEAYRSLLTPLAPDLPPEHAAYPDEELMAYPELMVNLAAASGDARLVKETGEFAADYFERVGRDYPGGEQEWHALLRAADVSISLEEWTRADRLLERLADHFPERKPWRADLRRARLLREQLGRLRESEEIIDRWSRSDDAEASVEAGLMKVHLLLDLDRLDEAEAGIRELRKQADDPEDRAEILYLWGQLEARRGSWEEARPRWGQAATNHPYTRFGMESQLAIATEWARRDEPRFAALALGRLYDATRRNTRHYAGSESARLAVLIESRADSLLGTLPASDPSVRNLLVKRGQPTEQP